MKKSDLVEDISFGAILSAINFSLFILINPNLARGCFMVYLLCFVYVNYEYRKIKNEIEIQNTLLKGKKTKGRWE